MQQRGRRQIVVAAAAAVAVLTSAAVAVVAAAAEAEGWGIVQVGLGALGHIHMDLAVLHNQALAAVACRTYLLAEEAVHRENHTVLVDHSTSIKEKRERKHCQPCSDHKLHIKDQRKRGEIRRKATEESTWGFALSDC